MNRPPERVLSQAFEECVALLSEGQPVEEYLAAHPDYAPYLAPLLQTIGIAQVARPIPARSPAVAAARRREFMAAATRLSTAPQPPTLVEVLTAWWSALTDSFRQPLLRPILMALLLLVAVGISSTQVIVASANALPGDPFYPVKRTAEQVQFLLARNDAERLALEQMLAARRAQEIQTVLNLGRPVEKLDLTGVIEIFSDVEWQVSGQKIEIAPQTEITGEPQVGLSVHGQLRAPGDNRLIAIWLKVDPGRRDASVADETPTTTATNEPPTPTSTPTAPEPTLTPTAQPTESPQPAVTATRTPPPSPTVTSTRPPSATPAVGPSPTRPQPTVSAYPEGVLAQQNGNQWVIQQPGQTLVIRVNAHTQLVNNPQIGDFVTIEASREPDGSYLAWKITAQKGTQTPTPEAIEFSGLIRKIDGEWWDVDGIGFRAPSGTQIEGDAVVHAFAEVDAERRAGGEIWARKIIVKSLDERDLPQGVIQLVSRDLIIVDGRTIYLDGRTQYQGDPVSIGRLADVRVGLMPDGGFLARLVYVYAPTPTPTVTSTRRPTWTPSPIPTFTPTPIVESTATPTTAPTAKPSATPTASPQPSHTPTSPPSATPVPSATHTPLPTVAPTIQPTNTSTVTRQAK